MAQPRRLDGISYNLLASYFVTSVTLNREKAFTDQEFAQFCEAALIDTAANFYFAIPAYVLMPDHVHLVLTACREGADFTSFVNRWKQQTGFEWSRRHRRRLWQRGYWERVLRDDEAVLSVCRYVFENPVRAKLVAHSRDYRFCGSTEYTVDEICSAAQIKGWWSA